MNGITPLVVMAVAVIGTLTAFVAFLRERKSNNQLREDAEHARGELRPYLLQIKASAEQQVSLIGCLCRHFFIYSDPPPVVNWSGASASIAKGPTGLLSRNFKDDARIYECYPKEYAATQDGEKKDFGWAASEGEPGLFFLILCDNNGKAQRLEIKLLTCSVRDGNIRWREVKEIRRGRIPSDISVGELAKLFEHWYHHE